MCWRAVWIGSVLALAGTSPAAWSQDEALRIVAPAHWCPLSCEAGRGRDGFSVDISRAALAREGVRIEYANLPYKRALVEVRTGASADAVLPAMRDEAPDFVFAAEPAAILQYCFFVEKDNPWNFNGIESLQGISFVASAGYRYGEAMDAHIASYHGVKVSLLTGELLPDRMIRMVLAKRVDAMLDDVSLVGHALGAIQDRDGLRQAGCISETFPSFLAISPARPDAAELARKYDRGLQALRESGELRSILMRYGVRDWDEVASPGQALTRFFSGS